jgi:YaiO family outer membrane protein
VSSTRVVLLVTLVFASTPQNARAQGPPSHSYRSHGTAQLPASRSDEVARAREMARAGRRVEAIALLQDLVAVSPADGDARVLLGAVLSWEGRYDEARTELETVLADSPTHGDALLAMISVELQSGHPERADELARRGLQQRPTDSQYLLARARALLAMKRPLEARNLLERLQTLDPRNLQAETMRRDLDQSSRLWQARVGASYDAFSDHRAAWRESYVSLTRMTSVGSIQFRGERAERFGLTDNQIGFEMYPLLRPGTYAYVAGAYSPNARLYPRHRYAVDLNQNLGAGFEGSIGFRRLGFGTGVSIYVGALSKYYGAWLFTGRLYVTPDSAGTSRSIHASARRYFGGSGTYVGGRYGRGSWRDERVTVDDFEVLDSHVVAGEAVITLRRRFELNVNGSYSREDRTDRLDLGQYSVSTGFGIRF